MTDVEKDDTSAIKKVKVILKWVKCCGSCMSPGFATVCTDGKD